jgi:hypothetical protein
MEGGCAVTFYGKVPGSYYLTPPNIYARGLIFGKMFMEYGDSGKLESLSDGFSAEIDFKTKAFFGKGGEENEISGKIKHKQAGEVFKIGGSWAGMMTLHPKEGEKQILFDCTKVEVSKKKLSSIEAHEEFESRNLWKNLSVAIKANDQESATIEKQKVEDNQRLMLKNQKSLNIRWESRFFHFVDGKWMLKIIKEYNFVNFSIDSAKTPENSLALVKSFITSGPKLDIHKKFWQSVPPQ